MIKSILTKTKGGLYVLISLILFINSLFSTNSIFNSIKGLYHAIINKYGGEEYSMFGIQIFWNLLMITAGYYLMRNGIKTFKRKE